MPKGPTDWAGLFTIAFGPAILLTPLKMLLLRDYAGLGTRWGGAYVALLVGKVCGLLGATALAAALNPIGAAAFAPLGYFAGYLAAAATILTAWGSTNRASTAFLVALLFPLLHFGGMSLITLALNPG